eukprot:6192501-Prymnesium_polylepis.1
MSGREVFEGNHERMGAHVIEYAKLAQPPPPRAGPNPVCAHAGDATRIAKPFLYKTLTLGADVS